MQCWRSKEHYCQRAAVLVPGTDLLQQRCILGPGAGEAEHVLRGFWSHMRHDCGQCVIPCLHLGNKRFASRLWSTIAESTSTDSSDGVLRVSQARWSCDRRQPCGGKCQSPGLQRPCALTLCNGHTLLWESMLSACAGACAPVRLGDGTSWLAAA